MSHELDQKQIEKRYRSNLALYDQQGRSIFELCKSLAESYVWMQTDRDFWKRECMLMMNDERKRQRANKKRE